MEREASRPGAKDAATKGHIEMRAGTCIDCGRPSLTLQCGSCAGSVREAIDGPRGDRRWNGHTMCRRHH